MGKIFDGSILDVKNDNDKGCKTKMDAATQQQLAKKLEGETYGTDKRSEFVRFFDRAKEYNGIDMGQYAVKAVLLELRKFRARVFTQVERITLNELPVCFYRKQSIGVNESYYKDFSVKFTDEGVFVYKKTIGDKSLFRDYCKIIRHLVNGYHITKGFNLLPSQTEVNGEKVLNYKPVTTLSESVNAIQRANIALDFEKVKAAAQARKEENARVDELEILRAKVLNGTATTEETFKFATLAK